MLVLPNKGVSCDRCMKSNFSGKRYKCLNCYDFDLCTDCYNKSQVLLESSSSSSASSRSSTQDGGGDKKTKNQEKNLTKTNRTASASNDLRINHHTHLNTHAMQCILTRSDHEIFYGNTNSASGIICDFTFGKI